MTLSIIAAVSENGVIGRAKGLPWRLSTDLKRFKQVTMGHTLIMGRKTWDSVGRPLPGRKTIVLTHDQSFSADGVTVAGSVREALDKVRGDGEVFIAGGGELFLQTLGIVDRMYVTEVHARIDGDTYFPQIDWSHWREVSREKHEADEKNQFPFSFVLYQRVN